eukprot:CAMPEP_0201905240 /NCGR_PEP_ID=MMETSP0902-20130614/56409_1 /ASSEMBLY_ACC=CAM_ASM_000551 /TAXON_ID=420261 /ORGANISM="Thalassiosira antarctica, Strain CCMP982" /LENGTH=406 /DNA_ID=CAMNT_0048439349 /DNA_START=483 /DNA_END=1703 /DNA_ORIENTATION=+
MPAFHAKYFPEKCHVGDYWYYAMRTEWQNTHKRMKNTILKHPASKYVLDSYKPTGAGDLLSNLKNVSLSNVTSTDNVFGSVSQTSPGKPSGFSSNSEPSASSKKCLDAEEFNNFCNSKGKSQPSPSAPKKDDRQEGENMDDVRDDSDQGRRTGTSTKKFSAMKRDRQEGDVDPRDARDQGRFKELSTKKTRADSPGEYNKSGVPRHWEGEKPMDFPWWTMASSDMKAQEIMSFRLKLLTQIGIVYHAREAIAASFTFRKQIQRQRMTHDELAIKNTEEVDKLERELAKVTQKLKLAKSDGDTIRRNQEVLTGAEERCEEAEEKSKVMIELSNMERPVAANNNGRMSKTDTKRWKTVFSNMDNAQINGGVAREKIKAMFYRKKTQPNPSIKFNPPSDMRPSFDFGSK